LSKNLQGPFQRSWRAKNGPRAPDLTFKFNILHLQRQRFQIKQGSVKKIGQSLLNIPYNTIQVNLFYYYSGCMTSLRRLASPAFGRPFLCVGVLFIINQWGELTNLVIHMISIFREANSSIDPELAPVFVGIVQVLLTVNSHINYYRSHSLMGSGIMSSVR
jgi:hypothetical protein